jgi:hypothetical protein
MSVLSNIFLSLELNFKSSSQKKNTFKSLEVKKKNILKVEIMNQTGNKLHCVHDDNIKILVYIWIQVEHFFLVYT